MEVNKMKVREIKMGLLSGSLVPNGIEDEFKDVRGLRHASITLYGDILFAGGSQEFADNMATTYSVAIDGVELSHRAVFRGFAARKELEETTVKKEYPIDEYGNVLDGSEEK
jgi:hypothetical protein